MSVKSVWEGALATAGVAVGATALTIGLAAPANAAVTSVRIMPTGQTVSSSDAMVGTSCTYAVSAKVTNDRPVTVVAARRLGPNQAATVFLATNKRPMNGMLTAYWTPKVPGTYYVSAFHYGDRSRPPIKTIKVGSGINLSGTCIVL
ncbi:hypothetical protein [Gordonia sp. ABSL49_1]|uniref:hypothetical protein n=1 Tax=Gordonia sp. ABSL49_1 TaxID=2920941 RepID=UPI001F113C99|nr:hypothetical protein [Gordonia sp. ABSL49_1]MCH5645326.1 hypothetical protein [Gordonia sp. ABSL49_1]